LMRGRKFAPTAGVCGKFSLTFLLLWLTFWTPFLTPAEAQFAPTVPKSTAVVANAASTPAGRNSASIKVGDRSVIERVNRRLQLLVERDIPVDKFVTSNVLMSDGQPLITLGNEPILTVTPLDAETNLMPARDLAILWGGSLSVAVQDARATRADPLRGVGYLVRDSIQDLARSIVKWLPRLAGAVLVWMVFWCLARLSRWMVRSATEHIPLDPNLKQLARTMSFYGVWATGIMAILSTLGIDSSSIATAVGISGFVLGFAFKDILSHFFAGLMLLLGRQFQIGGQIVVGEFEGTVERIELRALQLRTFDNRLVTIPNGDVLTSAVISNNAKPYRRREFLVTISYESNIGAAQKLALETISKAPGILTEPEPQVLIQELGVRGIVLRLLFYIDSTRADAAHIASECVRYVKEAFDREGIAIPGETSSISLEKLEAMLHAMQAANEKEPV
jgi:small conductance mechanosensitive channel